MAGISEAFRTHLAQGHTTVCRAWAIMRKDGAVFGFTDHDCGLEFEGIAFKADTGLSALALAQSTGLSVDNTEAIGALSDLAVRDEDIEAGRFDGAEVRAWLVNWADVSERWLQFRGHIGEIKRANGAFHAELRGLSEALNKPLGRVYQKPCTAVLGDQSCLFDLDLPGFRTELVAEAPEERRIFRMDPLAGFEGGWFTRGRLDVLDGPGQGLWGTIKRDRSGDSERIVELWEPLRAEIPAGTRIRLTAGCDKRMQTCRFKFDNLLNFQGFPDVPGEDWMVSVPKKAGVNGGGSRR